MTDIATRVYNHTWKIDPIVRSVLDTDFYKLLMAQTIFRRHKDVRVTFGIINRTEPVKLGRLIDIGELKEQLDHIRTLSLSRGESTWLRGNMFYGKRQMFAPEFIQWLEGFRFPAYHLERKRRPVRADLRGAVDRDHHVGDPGARRADGAAQPRRHQGARQVRAAGAVRARHDAGVGEDRPAQAAARPCASPTSARAGGTASCGRTGACRP